MLRDIHRRVGQATEIQFSALLALHAHIGILTKKHSTRNSSTRVQSSLPEKSPRPGSSVVERGPEKAGVGGSIPSLATTNRNRLTPYPRKLRSAIFAAFHPHIPCTPPPGGVDEEQR